MSETSSCFVSMFRFYVGKSQNSNRYIQKQEKEWESGVFFLFFSFLFIFFDKFQVSLIQIFCVCNWFESEYGMIVFRITKLLQNALFETIHSSAYLSTIYNLFFCDKPDAAYYLCKFIMRLLNRYPQNIPHMQKS